MSSSSDRRKSGNQRPRNNNNNNNNNNTNHHPQNIRREWIPRGSSSVAVETTLSPLPGIDVGLGQNWNGNGFGNGYGVNGMWVDPMAMGMGQPGMWVDPMAMAMAQQPVVQNNQNRFHPGSRGNQFRNGNQRREKEKETEREERGLCDHRGNGKLLKDVNLPQLLQEIQEKLLKGSVECMICYDMVRRSAAIWSCSSCYSIFHLNCIKKWARAPTSVDLSAEKNQGFNWRCPGCQSVQLVSAKDIRYMCFCGKRPDPPSDLYLTPHSCGEPCGKPLERQIPGSGMSDEDICPHVCVLQCHPGPCPPCKAFAQPRKCPCGKKVITTRCSDRKSVLTCGQRCDKLLECGRHQCNRICHVGPCDPCQVVVTASCFCKKKTEVVLCGDMSLKGDIKVEDGVFSCGSACEKKLDCGNHVCRDICHPGACVECELLPSKVKTCCCGKTTLNDERSSCLDPIPTCSQLCGKDLPCRLHKCQEACHSEICSPCRVLVSQKCRCGSTSRTAECYPTTAGGENFTCDKPCGRKKNCGRHRCSERCCPLSTSSNSAASDWNPHLCSMPCEKKLRCGQHSCTSRCHSGYCPPCMETIFTDLTCACGQTSIPPPLPCGTPAPSCQLPCLVPQSCGHVSSHSCHFGECPPCAVPIAKECVGGHVVLRNIPCGSKDIRCNKLCGKRRQCGLHACSRTCHPSPCDSSSGSGSSLRTSCGQTCGAPRRDCRHTCSALCHPATPCPDTRCEFPVTITCGCGRITATVPCDSGGINGEYSVATVREASVIQKLPVSLQPVDGNGKKIPLGQRKLMCDDECAKMDRKKVLADAFGVSAPNLEALHFGENSSISEVLSDLLRRDPKWVLSVEERFRYLVLGRGRGGANALKVHVFCPMLKEKRDAIKLMAERWKLSATAAGWEPKRFVVVHVTPKSKAPARILGVKSVNPSNMLQPAVFDPLVDMDPRLVVALFDLPREADISALVLRFGGECELVWLNDKNALAVFHDPARAATAMRRLDHGSVYNGAAVVTQHGGASATNLAVNAWGSAGAVAPQKGNPWKKVVAQDTEWKQGPWDSDEWSPNASTSDSSVWRRGEETSAAASSNKWSVLESEDTSKLSAVSLKIENHKKQSESGSGLTALAKKESSAEDTPDDVVDDWEKAYG